MTGVQTCALPICKLLILTQFIFWGTLYAQNYSVENAFPNLSFTDPVGIYQAGDGTNRLFVLEQPGKIMVFNNESSAGNTETFLNIMSIVDQDGGYTEEGLLGLAFHPNLDRKSTRLNSSHVVISYAVFCLKKKKK